MDLVFLLLSAALLLLAVLLLWFVPHLLNQQERRAAQEAQRLRNMLADVLGEQEAVARRQMQFGTSLAFFQDQLEQIHDQWPATVEQLATQPTTIGRTIINHLDTRLQALHGQLEGWMDQRSSTISTLSNQENESWAYLMSLLGTMQDQLAEASEVQSPPRKTSASSSSGGLGFGGGSVVVKDLRDEVESLRMISEEIAALQWRLRRSVANEDMAHTANGHH